MDAESSPDVSVVAGHAATSETAGSGGIGGYGGSSGNRDAGVAGAIGAGGIVGSGGMAGSRGGSTYGASSGGAPDAAAGTIGTGGIVGSGGMAGSRGGSIGGAGSGGSTSTGCQGLADCAPSRICNSGKCMAPQGLVVLTVPLTTGGQDQRYAYLFSPAANLTNKTVTLRMYAPDASAGLLNIYLSMANTASTAGSGALVRLRDLGSAWKDIAFNVGGAVGSFDPSQIKQVTIEVQSIDAGPWRNPTVIYIDSIVISTLTLGNTFDSSIGGFVQSSAQAISGSTLTWSNALP